MFSKKIFAFIMTVFLFSICSTTNAYGLAPFHSNSEVLMNLIKSELENQGASFTISNARYSTDQKGIKHLIANFDNNDKNEIDFALYKNGSVMGINIREDFSANRKFSGESRKNMLLSLESSMTVLLLICDVLEFELKPKSFINYIDNEIGSPMAKEAQAGRTPEPKMTYLNTIYNHKSEYCDIIIACNYEQGKITYVMLNYK